MVPAMLPLLKAIVSSKESDLTASKAASRLPLAKPHCLHISDLLCSPAALVPSRPNSEIKL